MITNNVQSVQRVKILLSDDMSGNTLYKVPENFPKALWISIEAGNRDEGSYLNQSYRRYKDDDEMSQAEDEYNAGDNNGREMDNNGDEEKDEVDQEEEYEEDTAEEEFEYFMERIMSAIAPTRNKFMYRKGQELLSKIYTVSDEAFGLLMLFNEFHCWEEDVEKRSGNANRLVKTSNKRFCDPRSGSKQGWSEDGRNLYQYLCFEVDKRRKEKVSIQFEERFKEKHSNGGSKDGADSLLHVPINPPTWTENDEVAELLAP